MQLLVSVRSAVEVGAALVGGADIIDAKEPDLGSLGPVSPDTLAEILALVPPECPFSIALGELASPEEAAAAIAGLELPARLAPTYVKLGFAGVDSPLEVARIVAGAVAEVAEKGSSALVVAVAYADAVRAGTPGPDVILDQAGGAGAAGLLLDTYTKDGIGLLSWLPPSALADWVTAARSGGLLTALAGALTLETLDPVCSAGADVVGVRGAACEGGRQGRVDPARVRALRQRVEGFESSALRDFLKGSQGGWRNAEEAANSVAQSWAKSRKTNA